VAKIVPYRQEYIARLAREKKVQAIFVGRRWMVDPCSLTEFYEQSRIEEDVISERLRDERMVEQQITNLLDAVSPEIALFPNMQGLAMHSISAVVTVAVGILLFFSMSLLELVPQAAQLSSFNSPVVHTETEVHEMVEVTIPFDMANGILLFSKDTSVTSVDPAVLFSDVVQVVEDTDGVTYLRAFDGSDYIDVPFVHLPPSQQAYVEVVHEESSSQVF